MVVPPLSGLKLRSHRNTLAVVVALMVVLGGCSGMSGAAEDEMMELMNHTGTEGMDAGVSMNKTTGTNETLHESELVAFEEQLTDGKTVVARSITLPEGGYAVVHDRSITANPTNSVVGVSEYLESGSHRNVTITLFSVPGKDFPDAAHLMGESRPYVVPHQETNDNQTFDWVTSNTTQDGPYRNESGAIEADSAVVIRKPR